MIRAGRFITLEGGEGVGKSTQIHRLAEALGRRGIEVVTTREPGGTEGAEAIRGLLLSGGQDRWNDATEALLFAAARADHVAKLIRPSVAAGKWVICDRFVDSTRAYQGGAGGISDADIVDLHRIGSGNLLPDRTILLDLSVAEGARRVAARSADIDRMGAKSASYYDRVAARFREMAEQAPDRFRVIDASDTPENVTARILDALADLL